MSAKWKRSRFFGSSLNLRQIQLSEWQHHWNRHRPHTALGGITPIERICELLELTPRGDAVEAAYDVSRGRIRIADHRLDLAVTQLK